MSKYILSLLLFCGLTQLSAQFGITGLYQSSQDGFTTSATPDGGTMGSGYEVAVDYWFRLPTKRIEFLPTLSFGHLSNTLSFDRENDFTFQSNIVGFQFKANFYLLDFGTDCDCPTFGKQGPALHKGFFVQVAPGVSLYSSKSTYVRDNISSVSETDLVPNLSVGAGLDFGISNLITVTPLVSYRFGLSDLRWEGLTPGDPEVFPEAKTSALQFGIRLGIRLDERRY